MTLQLLFFIYLQEESEACKQHNSGEFICDACNMNSMLKHSLKNYCIQVNTVQNTVSQIQILKLGLSVTVLLLSHLIHVILVVLVPL